jgi:outer membrane protein TolC
MKKVLLLLFFLILASSAVFSQGKKQYDIGILADRITPESFPLIDELKQEITAVVGEDAIIRFPKEYILVNDLDPAKAEKNYQALVTSEVDIILVSGIINNKIITSQQSYPKPTVLFGALNVDLVNIGNEKQASGIENFTYLISSRSYKADLSIFKELTNFKKLGILIDRTFLDMFPYGSFFDAELENLESNYVLIPFEKYEDIPEALASIDALYLAETSFLNDEEIKALAKECINLKIPSFTASNVEDVYLGIMASNQGSGNLNQFFRGLALMIESYVNGSNLSELTVNIPEPNLTLNYNTADRIGLPLKYSLISKTDFVGDLNQKSSERKYNLLEVMNQVLVENLFLQTSQKNVELSEKDIKAAWTNYIPNITAGATATHIDPDLAEISGGSNPEFSTDGTIKLTQTLFSAEANTGINTQKDLLESQREIYNADQLDAIFEASNAYFNTLIFKRNLQINGTNLDLTKRNLAIAEQNFEAGLSGKSDVLRFRSELANDMQLLVESANALDQAFFQLNQVLNNPIDYEIDVDEVELEKGLFEQYNSVQLREVLDEPLLRKPLVNFLIKEARENAPELKSLDYDISATGRKIRLNSEGRLLPVLALQGQYNYNFNEWGVGVDPNILVDNYRIGLNLSIPLVDQNRRNVNQQIGRIQLEQLDIIKSNTNLNIETNVNNAVVGLINKASLIELSKVSETAAKEALELTQISYSEGAVNIVQLLDAQNNYLNASLARATAVYEYVLASLQLERFIGYYFLLHTKDQNDEFIARFTQYMENNNNR